MNKCIFWFLVSSLIACVAALTSHIYLQSFFGQIQSELMKGHHFLDSDQYNYIIISLAYITAFIKVIMIATMYYYINGYVKFSKITKIIIYTISILVINGNLIRMPAMNAVVAHYSSIPHPILVGILGQLDQYVATLLMITVLVFLAPYKKRG